MLLHKIYNIRQDKFRAERRYKQQFSSRSGKRTKFRSDRNTKRVNSLQPTDGNELDDYGNDTTVSDDYVRDYGKYFDRDGIVPAASNLAQPNDVFMHWLAC